MRREIAAAACIDIQELEIRAHRLGHSPEDLQTLFDYLGSYPVPSHYGNFMHCINPLVFSWCVPEGLHL